MQRDISIIDLVYQEKTTGRTSTTKSMAALGKTGERDPVSLLVTTTSSKHFLVRPTLDNARPQRTDWFLRLQKFDPDTDKTTLPMTNFFLFSKPKFAWTLVSFCDNECTTHAKNFCVGGILQARRACLHIWAWHHVHQPLRSVETSVIFLGGRRRRFGRPLFSSQPPPSAKKYTYRKLTALLLLASSPNSLWEYFYVLGWTNHGQLEFPSAYVQNDIHELSPIVGKLQSTAL